MNDDRQNGNEGNGGNDFLPAPWNRRHAHQEETGDDGELLRPDIVIGPPQKGSHWKRPTPQPQWTGPPGSGRLEHHLPETDSGAVVALFLSLLSFVFCPLIAAIVGVAMAHGARERINASRGQLVGLGLARAAQILGWINIVFFGLITYGIIQLARWLVELSMR